MSIVSLKGIYHYLKKDTIGEDFKQIETPDFCTVSLKLPNVSESEPVVEIGAVVKEGSLLAKPSTNFGSYIYSPVSGKILNIFNKIDAYGNEVKHILIMSDKNKKAYEISLITISF